MTNAARDAAIEVVARLTGETVSAEDAEAAVKARSWAMEILANGEFWVAVGFIAMIGIFLYAGAPKFIGKHLDDRAVAIKAELDEAARLRAEAAAVLAFPPLPTPRPRP